MAALTDRERAVAIVAFNAVLAYQVYAVTLALRQVPTFMSLFAGLGSPLPLVTRAFLASFHFWWIAPLLFACLTVDVLRRRDPPLPYFSAVFAASTATAFGMHIWMTQALFTPLYEILRRMG